MGILCLVQYGASYFPTASFKVLYRKGLQNLFPQTCIALRILSPFLRYSSWGRVYLQHTVIGKKSANVRDV